MSWESLWENFRGFPQLSRTAETVKLSYESIEWTYVKIDPATGRAASAAAAQWGLPANEGQQTKR